MVEALLNVIFTVRISTKFQPPLAVASTVTLSQREFVYCTVLLLSSLYCKLVYCIIHAHCACMPKATVHRKWTEKSIQDAISDLHAGHSRNVSSAAQKFQIPRCTLRNRWLGLHESARKAHERRQHLSAEEETTLCEWVEHCTRLLTKYITIEND
jgi:hypothetical protein